VIDMRASNAHKTQISHTNCAVEPSSGSISLELACKLYTGAKMGVGVQHRFQWHVNLHTLQMPLIQACLDI
jgi:hypothetical protein